MGESRRGDARLRRVSTPAFIGVNLGVALCIGMYCLVHVPRVGAATTPPGARASRPTDYFVLVDTSKSMAKRFSAVKNAVCDLVLTRARPGDGVWIIPFDAKYGTLCTATIEGAYSRSRVAAFVQALKPSGDVTDVRLALLYGHVQAQEARRFGGSSTQLLMVFSDLEESPSPGQSRADFVREFGLTTEQEGLLYSEVLHAGETDPVARIEVSPTHLCFPSMWKGHPGRASLYFVHPAQLRGRIVYLRAETSSLESIGTAPIVKLTPCRLAGSGAVGESELTTVGVEFDLLDWNRFVSGEGAAFNGRLRLSVDTRGPRVELSTDTISFEATVPGATCEIVHRDPLAAPGECIMMGGIESPVVASRRNGRYRRMLLPMTAVFTPSKVQASVTARLMAAPERDGQMQISLLSENGARVSSTDDEGLELTPLHPEFDLEVRPDPNAEPGEYGIEVALAAEDCVVKGQGVRPLVEPGAFRLVSGVQIPRRAREPLWLWPVQLAAFAVALFLAVAAVWRLRVAEPLLREGVQA